jgi:lipooligosaccharide transport system permease protein
MQMSVSIPPAAREFSYRWLLYRRTWRMSVVMNFVNPVLFLVGIGYGVGRLAMDFDYLAFLAPGLLVASAMQTSVIEATISMHLSLHNTGSYRSAAMTPLSPGDILTGHLLFMTFRVFTGACVFFLVMLLFGTVESPAGVLAIPVAVLTSMAIALPFVALAMIVTNFDVMSGIRNVILMPMYLLAGTFVPVGELPAALQPVAEVLPLTLGVDVARDLTTGHLDDPWLNLGVLAGIAVAGLVAARFAFRRALEQT